MLFKDILTSSAKIIEPEFDKLLDLILKNQTHEGDLLLVFENGHYNAEANDWNMEPKISPYMIGPTIKGHSEHTHYEFIHRYRTASIISQTHPEYLKLIKHSSDRSSEIEKYKDDEAFTIQIEMLIYLKIWEGESFIKKLYELVRLASGAPYDWHFKISESNRDNLSTGSIDTIIRNQIRDPLEVLLPNLYQILKATYKSQIRNSIAHSNYSILDRSISLNNFIEKDKAAQLTSISFDEWIEIFHNTMIIYNELIRIEKQVQKVFVQAAKENNNFIEVRIKRQVPKEDTLYNFLTFREGYQGWNWVQNIDRKNNERKSSS